MENNVVYTKSGWENTWGKSLDIFNQKGRDILLNFIDKYISYGEGDCIEIGCVPGTYLFHIAEKGYRISGVDWAKQVAMMPIVVQQKGYVLGEFYHADIMKFYPRKTFNIVCSFGFIEHFTNWPQVIARHCALVKDGGLLMVTFPNLRGAFVHALFAELAPDWLQTHHLPAMDAHAQAEVARTAGLEILFEGYFGGFDFLPGKYDGTDTARELQFKALTVLSKSGLGSKMPDHEAWSPFGGFVARRSA